MFKRMSIRTRIILSVTSVLIVICITITLGIFGASKGSILRYAGESEDIYTNNSETDTEAETTQEVLLVETSGVIEGIMRNSLIIMMVSIIIGIFGTRLAVKRALRPISDLSRTIAGINEQKLNKPLALPYSHDEIAELTKSFNRMLTRLNSSFEAQKRFAATAAHELKTPLSAIITNIEVLELDKNPDYKECLETILLVKANAFRMEHLIQDLLSTYSNGNVYKKEKCNLRSICEKIGNSYMKIDDKQIKFEINGELCVIGDSLLLERAISNLIENAFRYNRPNGSVTILLNTKSMIIQDTGIGIPEKDLDKIFEPFYRVDVSRSRELGGSGLGLSIAKQIFNNHHATLHIMSEYGIGTKAIVLF